MKEADVRGGVWKPAWAIDPTESFGVISLPARPHPTALLVDVPSVEVMLGTLCTIRGRLQPAPLAWRTEEMLRRMRALMLSGG